MGDYYYLGAALPPLQFPQKPNITVSALRVLLSANFSAEDLVKKRELLLMMDILNLRPFLQEEEIDPRGNLGEEDLGEAIVSHTFFPEYVFDFLEKEQNLQDKIEQFPSLLSTFFCVQQNRCTGFLRDFFTFERESRLVALAFRAKKAKRDVSAELHFADAQDPLVAQILSYKESEAYIPPVEYQDMEALFRPDIEPWEQNKAWAAFRFNRIEVMKKQTLFHVDTILAYLAQLLTIEHWNELDATKGKMVLDTFKTR